jgi:hypothetical protein
MEIALEFVTLSQLWRRGGQQMADEIKRARYQHRWGGLACGGFLPCGRGLAEGQFNGWSALERLAPGGAGGLQGFGVPAGMAGHGHDPGPIPWGQQDLQDFGPGFVGEHPQHPMAPGFGITLGWRAAV